MARSRCRDSWGHLRSEEVKKASAGTPEKAHRRDSISKTGSEHRLSAHCVAGAVPQALPCFTLIPALRSVLVHFADEETEAWSC